MLIVKIIEQTIQNVADNLILKNYFSDVNRKLYRHLNICKVNQVEPKIFTHEHIAEFCT